MPWQGEDVIIVSLTTLIGLLALGAGWFGASGSLSVSRQAAWLNAAVLGLVASSMGNCVWLLRGRRAIGARRVSLVSLTQTSVRGPAEAELEAAITNAVAQPSSEAALVQVDGATRVHHLACPMLAGKTFHPAQPADGRPCGMCAR